MSKPKAVTLNQIRTQRPTDEAADAGLHDEILDESRGNRLADLRRGARLTQEQLAARIGVDQPRVSRIERGDLARTEVGSLAAYAEAMGGTLELVVHIDGSSGCHDLGAAPDAARQSLVFVPQKPPLAPLLSPAEHLEAMIALRSLPQTAQARYHAAGAALGIERFVNEPCRTLSGGTQQKVALSLAYAVAADVLLLDEPWTGLDILSARALRTLLEAERDRGAALLAASHLPETALALADRAVVLAGGRVVVRFDAETLAGFGGDPRQFETAIVDAMRQGEAAAAADGGGASAT